MTILGEGFRPRTIEIVPTPDPTLAVLEAIALLREGLANLPVPQVHVSPQDLSDVVAAVQGLNGPMGPSATEIAAAIRAELMPVLGRSDTEPGWTSALLNALENLDFRLKGLGGGGGFGGTVATISTISDVVRTKPEPGFTWPVSGTVGTGGLTDTQLRASPVPVSGTVTATGPLTDAQLRAATVPVSGTVALDGTAVSAIQEALTNTELRATPVPVSGTVSTGGLTDTQLRATAVPVSGTVTATGPLTDTQLRATAVPVSGTVALDATAVSAIQEALTNTELRATPVPVSGTVTPAEIRTLTQRMYEKSPQSGYHLWLDVTSTSSTAIYIAEAPDGSAQSATVFQGIRVTLDASGNPLGATETATAFRWDQRSTATWVS